MCAAALSLGSPPRGELLLMGYTPKTHTLGVLSRGKVRSNNVQRSHRSAKLPSAKSGQETARHRNLAPLTEGSCQQG